MAIYDSADIYIGTASDTADRIVKIDQVINALLQAATTSAANANISEYSLDDGQTKIKTVYKDVAQIFASINAFEKLKQMYINQLNGRHMRLVDGKNFTGCR